MPNSDTKIMKKRKYSTIVFDLGNVLIPFDHGLWINNFNKIETGLGDRYYKLYLEHTFERDEEVRQRFDAITTRVRDE